MRISTPSGFNTYPDATIFKGGAELIDNDQTLLNPVLIVEVMSSDSRSYDQGEKFTHYRSIPSLQDYLMIDSEFEGVMHYQRESAHEWTLREYNSPNDKLILSSMSLRIPVSAFYEGVEAGASKEQLATNDILHPSNRKWLKGLLQKGREDRDAGRLHDATPEFFQDIIQKGLERHSAKNK